MMTTLIIFLQLCRTPHGSIDHPHTEPMHTSGCTPRRTWPPVNHGIIQGCKSCIRVRAMAIAATPAGLRAGRGLPSSAARLPIVWRHLRGGALPAGAVAVWGCQAHRAAEVSLPLPNPAPALPQLLEPPAGGKRH